MFRVMDNAGFISSTRRKPEHIPNNDFNMIKAIDSKINLRLEIAQKPSAEGSWGPNP